MAWMTRWMVSMSLVLALTSAAAAATRHVRPGGTGPAPYVSWATAAGAIDHALAIATNGDDVLVSNGTYLLAAPVVVTNAVWVHSVGGAGQTVLDGGRTTRCVEVRSPGGSVEGFTITRGVSAVGGGVYLATGGTLRACRVVDNRATSYGGGVECYHGGWLLACVVESNQAPQVGGVDMDSGGVISGCLIRANSATDTCGGVFAYYGGVIRESVVRENEAVSHGGGVYLKGGGIVSNCSIQANTGQQGGGVNIDFQGTVVNSLLTDNRARDSGGGVYFFFGGELRHSTVSTNSAQGGGGVYGRDGGRILASIVSGNSATNGSNWQEEGTNAVFVSSCSDPARPGLVVIGAPGFVGPELGDFRLSGGSPCIDAAGGGGPGCDRQGYPRPLDGDGDGTNESDIGAFEYAGTGSDSDGDGLSDAWELAQNLSPASAVGDDGASGDPDADRFLNRDEYRADTRPRDASSYLRLIDIQRDSSAVSLFWRGGRDSVQYVETCSNMPSTEVGWRVLFTNYPPATELVTNTLSGGFSSGALFRIRADRQ